MPHDDVFPPDMPITRRFLLSMLTSSIWWLGVALALLCGILVSRMMENKAQAEFEYQTANAALAIESALHSYTDALRGVSALFYTGNEVSRAQFHAYVGQLELATHFPAITHLHYLRYFNHAERPAYETAMRINADAAANLDGINATEFAIDPPGARSEYQVLTYLEPAVPDGSYLGKDLGAQPMLAAMLARARDTGELTASNRALDMGNGSRRAGLLLHVPLYRAGLPLQSVAQRRAAYIGAVGAKLDLQRLVAAAFERRILPELQLHLHDGGTRTEPNPGATGDTLLYASSQTAGRPADGNLFVKEVMIDIGPRLWRAEFSARKSALVRGLDALLPVLVVSIGLAASVLLYGAYYALTTARRRAVELAQDMTRDLRANKESLAEAQQMARLGSWLLDPEDDTMSWSEETFHLFGMQRYSISPTLDDFLNRIHEDDRERVLLGLLHALDQGNEFRTEHRIRQRGQGIRWVQLILRPTRHGQQTRVRGAMMDITERKQTLEALTRSQELLRDLTAYQERVREDERRRIAREIHDELGQTLLALRIDVSLLEARTAARHPRLHQRVREALQQLDGTVKTIRTIINNLRPAALDLGLVAAFEWQVKEFRRRSGLTCELHLSGSGREEDFQLDDARATALFRILQESLTNVIRHAKATQVVIQLRRETSRLVMIITDNGVGIAPVARRPGTSFGLVGVEERVHALRGEFRIDSSAGKGTRLSIFIPLDDATPATHATDATDASSVGPARALADTSAAP